MSCAADPGCSRFGLAAMDLFQEPPPASPTASYGNGTKGYACEDCCSEVWVAIRSPRGKVGQKAARDAAPNRQQSVAPASNSWRWALPEKARVSRWSSDLSRLKSSSICQRSRYKPMTAMPAFERHRGWSESKSLRAARVRAAIARAGIQAIALAESQVLWLLVAVGGYWYHNIIFY